MHNHRLTEKLYRNHRTHLQDSCIQILHTLSVYHHRRGAGAVRHGAGHFAAGGKPVQPAHAGDAADRPGGAVAARCAAGSVLAKRVAAAGPAGLPYLLRPAKGGAGCGLNKSVGRGRFFRCWRFRKASGCCAAVRRCQTAC